MGRARTFHQEVTVNTNNTVQQIQVMIIPGYPTNFSPKHAYICVFKPRLQRKNLKKFLGCILNFSDILCFSIDIQYSQVQPIIMENTIYQKNSKYTPKTFFIFSLQPRFENTYVDKFWRKPQKRQHHQIRSEKLVRYPGIIMT